MREIVNGKRSIVVYNETPIRVVYNGGPWFHTRDIYGACGYTSTTGSWPLRALQWVDEDYQARIKFDLNKGGRTAIFLSPRGVIQYVDNLPMVTTNKFVYWFKSEFMKNNAWESHKEENTSSELRKLADYIDEIASLKATIENIEQEKEFLASENERLEEKVYELTIGRKLKSFDRMMEKGVASELFNVVGINPNDMRSAIEAGTI